MLAAPVGPVTLGPVDPVGPGTVDVGPVDPVGPDIFPMSAHRKPFQKYK